MQIPIAKEYANLFEQALHAKDGEAQIKLVLDALTLLIPAATTSKTTSILPAEAILTKNSGENFAIGSFAPSTYAMPGLNIPTMIGTSAMIGEGTQIGSSQEARPIANQKKEIKTPIEFVDERFTSAEADRLGGEASRDEKAAMLILQSYLENH